MNCEICGKRTDMLVKIKLEGATIEVCEKCSALGQKMMAPAAFAPKRQREFELPKEEIIENYSIIVKNAREKSGLTQEQLAAKILEKEFIIQRIEQGRMAPTIEIAKKLQHSLGIQLITMAAQEKVEAGKIQTSTATIADYIKIKKK